MTSVVNYFGDGKGTVLLHTTMNFVVRNIYLDSELQVLFDYTYLDERNKTNSNVTTTVTGASNRASYRAVSVLLITTVSNTTPRGQLINLLLHINNGCIECTFEKPRPNI